MLEAAPEDIELAGGRAFARGAPMRALALADIVKAMAATGRPTQALEKFDAPSAPTIDPLTGQGRPFNDYTFGTQAVEVEVDAETGETRATRLVACYDVGQVINRRSAEGQIEGGAVQGLGHALFEEVVVEQGIVQNPHLIDYKIPTSLDSPEVETILIESGDGLGPFGAKGIGEPAMTPTPAAVMNAVSRAVGRRIDVLPITAERVLEALRAPGGPDASAPARGTRPAP
jgi:CO/xanthine dehydrogenase Mo-binding subunit